MGEYMTADILMAIKATEELLTESEDKNLITSINLVLTKLKESLATRPNYYKHEVNQIIDDISINFGAGGYLTRAIMCVGLMRMAYSASEKGFEEHCRNVETLLAEKKEAIRSR